MRYRAVIFDLFGTLVDSYSRRAYQAMLAQMAAQLGADAQAFALLWDESFPERASGALPDAETAVRTLCARLGVQPEPEQVQAAVAMRLAYTQRTLVPREGAIETLRALRQSGLRIGLISDCTWEVPRLWDATPFAELFDATIFSCTVHLKKPDPAIYRLACERLEVAPADCLYVGDGSSHELSGAAQVGMTPLLIRTLQEEAEDAHRAEEDQWSGPRIASLPEVLRFALTEDYCQRIGETDYTD